MGRGCLRHRGALKNDDPTIRCGQNMSIPAEQRWDPHTRPRPKRHVKKWEDQENYRNHKSRRETKSNTSRKTHTSYKNNKNIESHKFGKNDESGYRDATKFQSQKNKSHASHQKPSRLQNLKCEETTQATKVTKATRNITGYSNTGLEKYAWNLRTTPVWLVEAANAWKNHGPWS